MNYSLAEYALRILVVDDEHDMVATLQDLLEGEGNHVDVAFEGKDALTALEQGLYDLVLTDLAMPGMDGVELLKEVKGHHPDTEVMVITGYGTINSAVEAMRQGALNYLIKPVEPEDILLNVDKLRRRLFTKGTDHGKERFHDLIGKSAAMRRLYKLIPRIAQMQGSVLIQGESGVGKELVANAIHQSSLRKDKRFMPIDCGALTDTLLESELFGHKQGSFTGSTSDRMGLVESANGGTLFLDEVGNSSPYLQSRLLRVIEEKKVRRIGDNNMIPVDVRILAASNEDLKKLVDAGQFRKDLYYRLCGFVIDIPPLRDRKEDIPLLAQFFLDEDGKYTNEIAKTFAPEAMEHLMQYYWPGNVRELRIVIDRACALAEGSGIEKKDILITHSSLNQPEPGEIEGNRSLLSLPFYSAVEAYERRYLAELLEYVDGNISQASQLSGASRKTIREKGKKYGLL